MIVPLEKLMSYQGNKYAFTRAAMIVMGKKGNLRDYPEKDGDKKAVSHILKKLLNDEVKYVRNDGDN